jgi:hypothetical protein
MENSKPSNQTDEIDIGQLFSRIGKTMHNGWMGFMRFLATLRRIPFENKLSFTIIIVASLVIAFLFAFFLKKNYYESNLILSSEYLNKRLAINTVDKLSLLAQESNKKGLARALNLPDTLADNIIGFEVKPFVEERDIVELEVLKEQLRNSSVTAKNQEAIDQIIQRIEIENRHAFEITVRTLNPSVIPNLQNAVVGYFRENPYIKKRIEISKLNLNRRKEKLESDVRKIDSLKNVIYENFKNMAEQSREGSNNVIMSDKAVTDPVEIYTQGLNIYDQLQEVNRKLYLQPDFEIVDGFTEFSEPASASLLKTIFYAVLIGIVIAYIDVALRSFNSYLANLK